MRMGRQFRAANTLDFIQSAAHDRINHYRGQAEHFRELATAEPVGRLRTGLVNLARQYDELADSIEIKSVR